MGDLEPMAADCICIDQSVMVIQKIKSKAAKHSKNEETTLKKNLTSSIYRDWNTVACYSQNNNAT